ncbi:hypothetical protein EE612_011961, partial [Oryza sativa]
RTARWGPCSRR